MYFSFRPTVIPPEKQRKFIVFESCLLALFAVCAACKEPTRASVGTPRGTFVKVTQWCRHCKEERVWDSQPYIRDVPAGNLLLSTAILCAGALPSMILRVLRHFNVSAICKDTFFRHQTVYLQPCISTVWMTHQTALLQEIRQQAAGEELILAGDGRSDSPGYTAKYGSYSLVDLKTDKVITFELIQVKVIVYHVQTEK
jgi:hypothetical protein